MTADIVREQAPPVINERPAVWPLVIEDTLRLYAQKRRLVCRELVTDMRRRDEDGRAKYGTPLQPFNQRNQLVDAFQEVLDLCVYLRAAMCEGVDGVVDMYERAIGLAVDVRALLLARSGGVTGAVAGVGANGGA